MKNHKQQLRVGNILHHIGLGTCKVLGIHNDGSIHICDIRDNAKQHLVLGKFTHRLEPVSLTKEWFAKCNIKPDDFCHFSFPLGNNTGFGVDINSTATFIYEWDFKLTIPIKHIEFVHELQNLYYTLTGKELIFNEYVNDFPRDEFIDESDDI